MNCYKSPFVVFVLLFFLFQTFAQTPKNTKSTYLQFVKNNFKNHGQASLVDSLWLKTQSGAQDFRELSSDIEKGFGNNSVDYELSTELLKERLAELDAKSPFKIEYNIQLENLIKSFLKNRKRTFERLMATSEYYFPQIEEVLAKNNIPLEIKYLAIVESALNPKATSPVGATGLWQFMYNTGIQYNLKIDSYIDERCDPSRATQAAAEYMNNMYKIFGDWQLVLAAYNSGPGNVSKAIRRADGKKDFWSISPFLPKETQGYVPTFIATMYLYEYREAHGFKPNRAVVKHFETDTIHVKKQVSFKQISDLLNISVAQIQNLNPLYKLDIVPIYKNQKNVLRLPSNKLMTFVSNEAAIYDYVQNDSNNTIPNFATETIVFVNQKSTEIQETCREKIQHYGILKSKSIANHRSNLEPFFDLSKTVNRLTEVVYENVPTIEKVIETVRVTAVADGFYMVQFGESLRTIALKIGVTEADLQLVNNLEDTKIVSGQILNIKLKTKEKENQLVANLDQNINHVVKPEETIYTIARIYTVFSSDIRKWNNLMDNNVKVGDSLKILKTNTVATNTIISLKGIVENAAVARDNVAENK